MTGNVLRGGNYCLIFQKDFVQIMKNLPVEVSDEDIEEMWSFADKNGDGKLSYKEFKAITQFSQSRKQLFNCST